jgi:hypothetical protein
MGQGDVKKLYSFYMKAQVYSIQTYIIFIIKCSILLSIYQYIYISIYHGNWEKKQSNMLLGRVIMKKTERA